MNEFDDLMKYLAQQFPATVGHISIREKVEALEKAAQRRGVTQAIEKIRDVKRDWEKSGSYAKSNAAGYLIHFLTER